MAKFKISLLTAVSDDNTSRFIATTLSDYESQIDYDSKDKLTAHKNAEPSFCYTYNEKYSQHQNAQKELSFSMDRKLFMHDEWATNPYVAAIHVGSTVELIDKYNNTILFVVTKITYDFKENNIIYNYTCQDAFSYQHSRQQSGYTIENDSSSDTFIGPKTIDWWVIRKIVPECYIKYNYIPLQIGLYIDKNNIIQRFTSEDRAKWNDDSRTIIKEPFDQEDYQTTITFSCSNSNANAALISLGENLDLMLHTFERRTENGLYQTYFWYEPKQNQEVSDLQYSPKSQVSNFGLDFSGDALTTVLNVNSHEVGDDLITLIPSTPAFFTNLFMSKEWADSKFYPGYFTDIINGKNYHYSYYKADENTNDIKIETNIGIKTFGESNFVVIQLKNKNDSTFTIPTFYNRFADNWGSNKYTTFNYILDSTTYTFSGKRNSMYLILVRNDSTYTIVHEDEEIPQTLLNTPLTVYLGFRTAAAAETAVDISDVTLYLNFYRTFTEEEKEFATIADQCPWLENRLVDFSYYYQQGIISRNEYETLMNLLQNDLRIVNGKLLYLTDTYYRAVKTKTQILSELTNKLDSLAATFEAQIITPLRNGETLNDISSFISAYATTFGLNESVVNILNYDEIISDYFEKYANAEQRFLKNIYAFRKYFNEPCTFTTDAKAAIYTNTISSVIGNLTDGQRFISFGAPVFKTWDGKITSQLFYEQNGHYVAADIITDKNKTNYFYPVVTKDSFIRVDEKTSDYNTNATYWIPKGDYEEKFGSISRDIDKIVMHEDDNGIVYYQLSSTELKRLILAKDTAGTKYYFRNTETYRELDKVRYHYENISEEISWITLPNLLNYWDEDSDWGSNQIDLCDWGWNDKYSGRAQFCWNYYKSFYPLTEIYYKGPVIKCSQTTTANNKVKLSFETLNEKGQVDKNSTYEAYQAVRFAGNGSLLKSWGPCVNDVAVEAKAEIEKNWTYVGGRPKWNIMWWSLLLGGIGSLIITLSVACSTCEWKTGTNSYWSFEGEGDNVLKKNKLRALEEVDKDTINKQYYRYDSYFANYGVSIDSSDTYQSLTRAWYSAKEKLKLLNTDPEITWYKRSLPTLWANQIEYDTSNLNENLLYHVNEYFNFYQNVVVSYSFRDTSDGSYSGTIEKPPLYVKDKFLRILNKNSIINKNDNYICIPIYADADSNDAPTKYEDAQNGKKLSEHTKYIYIKNPDYFTNPEKSLHSAITWYPLEAIAQDVTTTQADVWGDNKTMRLGDWVEKTFKAQGKTVKVKETDTNNAIFVATTDATDTSKGTYIEFIYARVENYVRDKLGGQRDIVSCGSMNSDYLGSIIKVVGDGAVETLGPIYSQETDLTINPLDEQGALENINNLYIIPADDTSMTALTAESDFENLRCYKKTAENTYERIYSKNQIAAAYSGDTSFCTKTVANKFKYISGSSISFINFTEGTTDFTVNLYFCTCSIDKDGNYTLKANKNFKTQQLSFATGKTIELTLTDDDGLGYTSIINLVETKGDSLSNVTNGLFWYRYHSQINLPTLFEFAASIETQLQTYWSQAYTASKYCKYFLPQYWQPNDGETKNAFAKDIIQEVADENGEVTGLTLSNKYLPVVEIYINDAEEVFRYKHYLNKYLWKYNPSGTDTWGSINENDRLVANQDDTNYTRADTVADLKDNPGINDILNHLGTRLSDWGVVKNGYTVYYYCCGENSGMLWKDVAHEMVAAATFERFDGLYGMAYDILSHNYQNRNLNDYEAVKQQKQAIWNRIYAEYPFLMLEDNYSYDLATTSEELLKMAQLVFKAKREPEKAYSIGLIDTHSLLGYIGQELTPGQGIRIKVNDYYDEIDDIQQALSQYLFITDVSYTLRSDADIGVTVNSIKYQEKLIQSLAKLIR